LHGIKAAMSTENKPRRILVGEFAGAHGIRGDVLVRSYTETPDAIASYGPLTDASGQKSFTLRVVRVTSKGITDRNGAEPLRGTKLYVDRAKLPSTGAAEFYYADLIGLRAIAEDGSPIGEIVSVQNFGAGDLLELKPLEGETEFIPFENRWVPTVDLDQRQVVIVRPKAAEEDDDEDAPDSEAAGS
jgi:16S rRNA processing protein RimM